MSDSQELLVEQARNCLKLVRAKQLDEALVVLQSVSNALALQPADVLPDALVTQQLADVLAEALLGAIELREDTRLKLQRLRSVKQAKAEYSASTLPQ